MDQKPWWKSKIVWLGVINTLIAGLELGGVFLDTGDFSPVAISQLVIGILMVIARIWFTNTELKG
jgi:hypothetical protein